MDEEEGVRVNRRNGEDWWFCKTDRLEELRGCWWPERRFVLFTHNSDLPASDGFRDILADDRLIVWFAQNPVFEHPKLRGLPIGIANPRWPHGDQGAVARIQTESIRKTRLFDASFSIETNELERRYCVEQTRVDLDERRPFPEYLRRLASAYFCIAPSGNGVDTHRVWEALAMRTIPIVTRSVTADQHAHWPIAVLNDWAEFGSRVFTPDVYRNMWGSWTPSALRLGAYISLLEETIRSYEASTPQRGSRGQ